MKFQLGDWTIEESANLLMRGEEKIRVEKRVMAVLMRLAAAEGAVVSKDDLIDAVWGGAAVSDHSVANAVSDLRRALGDDRRDPRYIETVPKRGYRLVASPAEVDEGSSVSSNGSLSAPRPRAWAPWAAAVLAVIFLAAIFFWRSTPATPRLLLMDIENATGIDDFDIAGDTAGEMLTVALAGGDYRLVRIRTAPDDVSFARETKMSRHDRRLGGRIIMEGNEPVLALELVDGADGASVWADAYAVSGGRFGELFNAVVADLRAPLGLTSPPQNYMNADPSIAEAYWRARYLWSLREHGAIREALRILTEVTKDAPDYAPAHAALADIYAHKTAEELAIDRAETYPLAEESLARAETLDPDLSEASVTRAYLSFFREADPVAANAAIDKAIAANANNAIAWQTKAMIASAAGDVAASLNAIERARSLDPLSASILWDKVWFLYVGKRYTEALDVAQLARRISAPVHAYEALNHLGLGNNEAALESWLQRARERGLSGIHTQEIESVARRSGAAAGLAALAVSASAGDYQEHPAPLAALLIATGERETAIASLLNDRPREKSWWWSWYDVMPAFDDVRADPRLASLTSRALAGPG